MHAQRAAPRPPSSRPCPDGPGTAAGREWLSERGLDLLGNHRSGAPTVVEAGGGGVGSVPGAQPSRPPDGPAPGCPVPSSWRRSRWKRSRTPGWPGSWVVRPARSRPTPPGSASLLTCRGLHRRGRWNPRRDRGESSAGARSPAARRCGCLCFLAARCEEWAAPPPGGWWAGPPCSEGGSRAV